MDPFLRQQAIPTQPVESGLAVTPNDGANLVPPNGDPAKAAQAPSRSTWLTAPP
jgi:hypothetical protein